MISTNANSLIITSAAGRLRNNNFQFRGTDTPTYNLSSNETKMEKKSFWVIVCQITWWCSWFDWSKKTALLTLLYLWKMFDTLLNVKDLDGVWHACEISISMFWEETFQMFLEESWIVLGKQEFFMLSVWHPCLGVYHLIFHIEMH